MSQEVFMCFHCSCLKITSKTSFQKGHKRWRENNFHVTHVYEMGASRQVRQKVTDVRAMSEHPNIQNVFALLSTTFPKAGMDVKEAMFILTKSMLVRLMMVLHIGCMVCILY